MAGDSTVVLVADSDSDVTTGLRSLLVDDYRVETTTDGDEALTALEDADVVLVGHDLRTASGSIVAVEIDRRAGAYSMAVLSSGDREFESCHLTTDCLVKPIDEATLRETVDRLARRARYDELIAECATLAARRGKLESRARANDNGDGEYDEDGEYEAVQERLAELYDELDELVAAFDGDDFRAAFTACHTGTDPGTQQVERFS
ncbi:HalX domain-containing protein [Natrinema marinum]|uniref:HalX domain-containing protein n=1 Tax=Natrinema marinum TaxID=2961598 RepID=UPI0020C8E04D|nr:HalX domain-containing protein [Natrinema marinum]